MKKIFRGVLILYLIAIAGCTKKKINPSIVGKWALSDISGTIARSDDSIYIDTITYAYDNPTKTINLSLARTNVKYGPLKKSVSNIQILTEEWLINADGMYTISENYIVNSNPVVTHTTTGQWDYFSNTHVNNAILLVGDAPHIFFNSQSPFFKNGPFVIETISDKLVLKVVYAHSNTKGIFNNTNLTITFTRQ